MKRPEIAEAWLCRAHGRTYIEVGPWLFGAVCPDPEKCRAAGDAHRLAIYGGGWKRMRGVPVKEK